MDKRFIEAFEHDCDFARAEMLTRGEIRPMFVTRDHEAKVVTIFGSDGTDLGQKAAITATKLLAVAENAAAVTVISEAWAIDASIDEEILVAPRDSDRRYEIVLIRCETREGNLSRVLRIERGEDGKPNGFTLLPDYGSDGGGLPRGRMVGLLPPNEPSEEERAIARRLLDGAMNASAQKVN